MILLSTLGRSRISTLPDGLDVDRAAGERWLVQAHEGIQRVAVRAKRSTEVGRVGRGKHEEPVELDTPSEESYSYLLACAFPTSRTHTNTARSSRAAET